MTNIHKGDTIRLKATFYTFSGVPTNPTSVTCKVYDRDKTLIATLTPSNDSAGVYHADHTTANDGTFSYEFAGTLEGSSILAREYFTVGW